ncbi:DUF4555 domain-containing protein [Paenibacillus sp. CC-CFT747]|nr:DUF4555 domain-containing protein [Paenibacillus sp. CC-CFT747]
MDVQVYDRLVSLQVLNNEPFTASLLESHKEEIANGLAGLGYRFLSLKCSSFPEQPADLNEGVDAAGIPPVPAAYRSKPYKGVDLRI